MSYTKAISLNPEDAEHLIIELYRLRMNNYATALSDLDKSHYARPNYERVDEPSDFIIIIMALTEKTVADYEEIIALGVPKEGSLCGHRLLARNNGWNTKRIYGNYSLKELTAGCTSKFFFQFLILFLQLFIAVSLPIKRVFICDSIVLFLSDVQLLLLFGTSNTARPPIINIYK